MRHKIAKAVTRSIKIKIRLKLQKCKSKISTVVPFEQAIVYEKCIHLTIRTNNENVGLCREQAQKKFEKQRSKFSKLLIGTHVSFLRIAMCFILIETANIQL
jgi:hypothetical protein